MLWWIVPRKSSVGRRALILSFLCCESSLAKPEGKAEMSST